MPTRRLRSTICTCIGRSRTYIELGLRQTGKTYINQNASGKVFIISGSTVTPPVLFHNANTCCVGLLGTMDLVFFDEVAKTTFGSAEDTLNIFKQCMQSGQFTRRGQAFHSQASISLSGKNKSTFAKFHAPPVLRS